MIYVGMFRNTFLLFREKEIDTRATLDPTGRCHWAIICPVLPWWMPWSLILV
jgi:hypothetical protein